MVEIKAWQFEVRICGCKNYTLTESDTEYMMTATVAIIIIQWALIKISVRAH